MFTFDSLPLVPVVVDRLQLAEHIHRHVRLGEELETNLTEEQQEDPVLLAGILLPQLLQLGHGACHAVPGGLDVRPKGLHRLAARLEELLRMLQQPVDNGHAVHEVVAPGVQPAEEELLVLASHVARQRWDITVRGGDNKVLQHGLQAVHPPI